MPKKPAMAAAVQTPIMADMMPRGDGSFVLRPRVVDSDRDTWVSPREAAQFLGVGCRAIYSLFDEGEPMLVTLRPLPRKISVSLKSLQAYRRAIAHPAFWTDARLRNNHLAGVRAALAALASPGN